MRVMVAMLVGLLALVGVAPAAVADPHGHGPWIGVSDAYPEFGGVYLSRDNTAIYVLLTGDADQDTAEEVVDLFATLMEQPEFRDLEVRPRSVEHTWAELYGWRNELRLEGRYVLSKGMDERLNQVTVGVVSLSVYEPVVRAEAAQIGIPQSALHVFEAEPPVADDGSDRFTDVPRSSTHGAAIEWSAGVGVVRGYGDGTFQPEDSVTRAQMASMLDRALPLPQGGDPGFTDVSFGSTHGRAIANLAAAGIADGPGDGTFGPDGPVTRGQLVSFLDRALDFDRGDDPGFDDVAPGATHARAIANLTDAGVISGFGDGTFRPAEPVTRGQVASLLHRALTEA